MPEARVRGIRLHYDERGEGAPILCIHGGGSTALMWADAVEELARLGRVIAYDRRGCARSERPEPYERTTVAEQAADAAALLDALADAPAVVSGEATAERLRSMSRSATPTGSVRWSCSRATPSACRPRDWNGREGSAIASARWPHATASTRSTRR
jgi:Alpha/beta hydrolase family